MIVHLSFIACLLLPRHCAEYCDGNWNFIRLDDPKSSGELIQDGVAGKHMCGFRALGSE